MKTYRELTLYEAVDAKKAGKNLQIQYENSDSWITSDEKSVLVTAKYRLVEEDWKPEVGEMVHVKDAEIDSWTVNTHEFRAIVDGKFICRSNLGTYVGWGEVKPLPPDKKEPRDWWLSNVVKEGQLQKPNVCTSESDARRILASKHYEIVHVKEVLND